MTIESLNLDSPLLQKAFSKENIFCFTTDIEWAPEWAIRSMFEVFDDFGTPLTPFLTHKSDFIQHRFANDPCQVGVHPNFLPGSTHGNTYEEVINHVCDLWPEANFYRSHAVFDVHEIGHRFRERGYLFDSNLGLRCQGFLMPLQHQSGLVRFPIYWEDDIHWIYEDFVFANSEIQLSIDLPGLKVINVHPLITSLNITGEADYLSKKKLNNFRSLPSDVDWEEWVSPGIGALNFVRELLDYVSSKKYRIATLPEIYSELPFLDRP